MVEIAGNPDAAVNGVPAIAKIKVCVAETAGNPDAAVNGGLAIAVPLELKGLWLAHQRHGNLPWADLVAPVVPLARNGFPLHPYLAGTIEDGEWCVSLWLFGL